MSTLITLPQTIDDGRLDNILLLLDESKRLGNTDEEIIIDWGKTSTISPAGYAILCCVFDSLIEQRNKVRNLNIPTPLKKNPLVHNFDGIRRFSTLPQPDINNIEEVDLIVRGNSTSIDLPFHEHVEARFSHIIPSDLLYDCRLITNELMQNTVDHSTSERYYLYAGKWKHEFHFGLCDMGATTPAKLEQKYRCHDDCEYLELALQKGIGTRRKRPGGFGLYYFFEYMKEFSGKLTILSRNGQVRRYFKTRKSQITPLKYTLNGTWCFARLTLE
jgi:anti-sigma regulatory factor (Ser/Thr protein kinase)